MSEWISVKDRLPELDTTVLTFSDAYGVVIGMLDSDFFNRWRASHTDYETGEPCLWDAHYCNVTHWMPLPEPPKEADNG